MKPGASRDAPHGAPLMRRSGASQPWHAHHSGGGGGAPHLPMSWVLCLCAVTYLLGHYSPRPDLQALPRSPQAAGDAPAVSHGPRDSQASAAAVRVEPLEVLPQRQGYLDGQAPSDDLTLDSMLWQQARAAPTASQQAAAGSDAADAALAAAQAVQLPHSRKLIASPAAARAPGGAAAYAPAPGRGQLGSVEAAAARFLSDTGIARLRPPAAPGDGGEAGYRVIPFQVGARPARRGAGCGAMLVEGVAPGGPRRHKGGVRSAAARAGARAPATRVCGARPASAAAGRRRRRPPPVLAHRRRSCLGTLGSCCCPHSSTR